MRKNFGPQTWMIPLPVLIIGSYDENGNPNAMNAAWGGLWDYNKIYISLSNHKTTDNIQKTQAFTVSFADSKHVIPADYVGIVSGNQVKNKMEIAGLHSHKSEFVNAPIIEEFPLSLECKVESFEDGTLIGEIVNVSADESILDEKGNVDSTKIHAISFDPISNYYFEIGSVVGKAWESGMKLK